MRRSSPQKSFYAAAALLASASFVNAATLSPSAGYGVGDALSGSTLSAFDVYQDSGAKAYGWDSNSGTLRQYDVANGGVLSDFGVPPGGYADSAFISFVRRSPDGQSVWVGFTVDGNSDDRIYEVTNLDSTPTWNQRTSLAGNYDLEFSTSGEAFVSANLGGFSNPNKLFYLDAGDSFNAIEFAEVGGYSSDFAFDSSGSLVYGTNGLGANQLVSYASGDISSFLSNPGGWSPLALGDAMVLSNLPFGASGLYADDFGGIFVAMSDFSAFPDASGTLAQWSGIVGSSEHLDILATAGDSLGELDGLGQLLPNSDTGALYQSVGFGQPGLDVLVPEPGAYAMLSGALALAFVAYRRRR